MNNNPEKSKNKTLSIIFLVPILIFVFLFVISMIWYRIFPYSKQKVTETPNKWFPVAVICDARIEPNDVDIIFYADKGRYQKDCPNATFQVPKNNEQLINKKLKTKCRNGEFYSTNMNPFCDIQEYEIIDYDGKYQYIKSTYETSFDYVNKGWYKTDGIIIIPSEHMHYFGPGFVLDLFGKIFLITFIIYALILMKYFKLNFKISVSIFLFLFGFLMLRSFLSMPMLYIWGYCLLMFGIFVLFPSWVLSKVIQSKHLFGKPKTTLVILFTVFWLIIFAIVSLKPDWGWKFSSFIDNVTGIEESKFNK